MKKIYEVGGFLNRNFVGQISYTICLDQEYEEMDIRFSFDKQRYTSVTEELKQEVLAECSEEYTSLIRSDKELTEMIKGMKTEINTIVTMNDTFIGGIHRQLADRHMYFSEKQASDGCILQKSIHGVVKITLIVFNVLRDETHYTLSLSVNAKPTGNKHEETHYI